MKTFKTFILFSVLATMGAISSYAQTGMKEYIDGLANNKRSMVFDAVRVAPGTLENYLRSIEDPAPETAGSGPFDLLTSLFQELLGGKDPSQASMEEYQEFYEAMKSYPAGKLVLPTIAIWKNKTTDGLAPFRHQNSPFWADPEQAAKMYNTMAAVDNEKANQVFEIGISDDFASAYPTFPEGDLEGTPADYAHQFFEIFAKAGGFAKKDAAKLEEFVVTLLKSHNFI